MGTILCATRGGQASHETQDRAIDLAQERGDRLAFVFVVDISFLSQMAAPIVVDVEKQLEDMGRFELAMAQDRAAARGVDVQVFVRRGRLQPVLADVACELDADLIVLGRPMGETAVFEEDTLETFCTGLQGETGVEVRTV